MTSMTCREQTVLPFCEDDDFGCIYTAGLEAQFQFVDYIHFFLKKTSLLGETTKARCTDPEKLRPKKR